MNKNSIQTGIRKSNVYINVAYNRQPQLAIYRNYPQLRPLSDIHVM